MSSINNKRGLSQIVAMIIFILLTISAIGILIPSIRNLAQAPGEPLLSLTSCIQLQQNPSTIEGTDYNEDQLLVEVKRAFSGEVSSFDFILETNSGNTERFTCGDNNQCNNCYIQNIGQEKTFYFSLPDIKKVSLYANGNCLMDEEEVL